MPSEHRDLRDKARRLRRSQTDAERLLWSRLRNNRLGPKFRRQYPIDNYVVDFCCLERGLVIELDGGQHSTQVARDLKRTEFLVRRGYCVLRFWNNDVLNNIDGVLELILEALNAPLTPTLSPKGRG